MLQRELSEYWSKRLELPKGTMVSVSRVEVSPSLERAYVYISIWPEEGREQVWDILKKNTYRTQKYLDARLFMKFVPKITLAVDKGEIARREVENVLDSLENDQKNGA